MATATAASAPRQRYITARPGGPNGSSIDTWETLAARASQLANSNVVASDLISTNVGLGATADQINDWLAGVGGILSADGINYIFPAGLQVALPNGVTVPSDADSAAVDDASLSADDAAYAAADSATASLVQPLVGGLLLAGLLAILIDNKPRSRKAR